VRRRLLKDFDLHTTLRLPTDKLWVYDLRTNQHFTLQQNPLRPHHLDEFVECYTLGKPRSERGESERFKAFTYDELVVREKANLDITWLRDESLDDMDNLPAPGPGDHRPRDRRRPHRGPGRVRGCGGCARACGRRWWLGTVRIR
jgi:type I restriction enzyme M protein